MIIVLYLGGALLLILIGVALARTILRILQGVMLALLALGLASSALQLDQLLSSRELFHGLIIGAAIGFIFLVGGGAVVIRHTLIRFYLLRTIQRDRDAAKAGRLW